MKIKLLQVVTPEIMDYAKYTIAINRAYCTLHGYHYILYDNIDPKRHPSWSKVKAAIEVIKSCDLLFVLDADAYVQNHSVKVESFHTRKVPVRLCLNGENGGELLNCGSIIITNSSTTDALLKTWWDAGENHCKALNQFWEQDILNSLHNSGKDVPVNKMFKNHIYIHPMRDFNSCWLDMEKNFLRPRQFIQHMMARSIKDKARIAGNYYRRFTSNA